MNRYNFYLEKGLNHIKNNQYSLALKIFNECISLYPQKMKPYFYAGRIYYKQKKYSESSNFFDSALMIDPNNNALNFFSGKNHLILKRYAKAESCLIKSSESISESNLYLGMLYIKINEYAKSLDRLEIIRLQFCDDYRYITVLSTAYFKTANQLFETNNLRDAQRCLLNSISINKEFYPSYYLLGTIYGLSREYKKAIGCYRVLADRYPDNATFNLTLAFLYNTVGDFLNLEKVVKNIRLTNNFNKQDYHYFFRLLGLNLFNNKKYSQAIPYFLKLYSIKQYDNTILYSLARCRFYTGEYRKAINIYNIMIIERKCKDVMIINSYLLTLIYLKRIEECRTKSSEFISRGLYNNKTLLYYFYSSVFSGSDFNFESTYKVLVKKFNKNSMFVDASARYLINTGKINRAVDIYYKLYKYRNEDPYILSEIIELFLLRALNNQALYYMDILYKQDITNIDTVNYYAYHLIRNSNYKKAYEILRNRAKSNYQSAYLLHRLFESMGQHKKSFTAIYIAYRLNPIYLPIQYALFRKLYRKADYNNANKLIRLIKISNSSFNRVNLYQTLISIRENRFDEALVALEIYFKKQKVVSPYIKFIAAIIQLKVGNRKTAEKIVRMLIERYGEQAPYLIFLCVLYRKNYEIEKLKVVEKKLLNLKKSPSYQEYENKFLSIENKQTAERNDLGVRLRFIF